MKRRTFLKLTALMAASRAAPSVLPLSQPESGLTSAPAAFVDLAPGQSAAQLTIDQPGLYQLSGLVRLESPLVEISGISHSQSISWSAGETAEAPVARFVTFEHFDRAGLQPDIRI